MEKRLVEIGGPEAEAEFRAIERRGEEACFELFQLVSKDSTLRAKLDAGDFEGLLSDVTDIAADQPGRWQKAIETLTRVRDAKASDMGNIDDSDDPLFRWLSFEDICDLSARLRQEDFFVPGEKR